MKVGTTSTTKFNRLKRRTKLPTFAVVGLLESIWHITARDAPRGDIGRLENDDIAANIGWDGDAAELIEHLIDSKWLIRTDQYRLVVNDWREHCPNYIKANLKRQGLAFASELVTRNVSESATENNTKNGSEISSENHSKNTTTKPNQSNPIQETAAATGTVALSEGGFFGVATAAAAGFWNCFPLGH